MKFKKTLLTIGILFTAINGLIGQTIFDKPEDIKQIIKEQDALFWRAYNSCDIAIMEAMFTEDVEFYHDKNGQTTGLEGLIESLRNGLCANGPTLQREPKEGTVQIFPMKNIGAIISGEHYFTMNGQRLEVARFNHLWVFKDSQWKMSRVLSYDHRPASSEIQIVQLSERHLKMFYGEYEGKQTGTIEIQKAESGLTLKSKDFQMLLYPKSQDIFFIKERNLTFRFISNDEGQAEKILVIENGELAEELIRIKRD